MKFLLISCLFLAIGIALWSAERSGKWEKVRAYHLQIEPACAWCSQADIKKLEVHHIRPFHTYPELELQLDNLITFCRFCHFVVGHNCNWEKDNEDCRKEASRHKRK